MLSVGQIAGAVTIQFFGQIVARSVLLGRRGISAPANIAITTYERIAAAAISGLMALAGAWYLFGNVAIDFSGGGAQFMKIITGVLIAIAAGAGAAWGSLLLNAIARIANLKNITAIVRNLLLALVIQFSTASAYVIIAHSISEKTPFTELLAASVIIVFAVSIPVSFSGWGVRELSAVFALGALGVEAPAALAISILIGAMALGAVVLLAVTARRLP